MTEHNASHLPTLPPPRTTILPADNCHPLHAHHQPCNPAGVGVEQGGWILQPEELDIGMQIGLGSDDRFTVYKGTPVASGKTIAVKVRKPANPTALTTAARG